MHPEPLGSVLRRLRMAADLTLEQLSATSGVSDRALSDIERGAARGPHHRTMLAIVGALDLPDGDRAVLLRAAREGRRRPGRPPAGRLPLPRSAPDFTGRAAELSTVTAAATDRAGGRSPLVVVTGPPGYGKTGLALQAAGLLRDEFTEQVFVELDDPGHPSPTPDDVATRLAAALAGSGRPTRRGPGRPRALLAGRSVLVVLDGAASESQVRAVLPAGGPAAVLVTSRRSLAGLDGAVRVHLDRLRREDAQQFLSRIVPGEPAAGAELGRLAQLCDDVPLALRIAGNRLAGRPGSTVAGLISRLGDTEHRLATLTAGDLSVHSVIAQSHRQLGPGAQLLFRRLALVDDRTFGAGLAAALAEEPRWRAEQWLDELVDLGLVQPSAGDRFTLHELHRLFARAELSAQEGATARAAADRWLLSTAGSRTWASSGTARAWLTAEAADVPVPA